MVNVIHVEEKEHWDSEIREVARKDIYYLPNYCNLYRILGEGDPYLFVYDDHNGGRVVYPFLKRTINASSQTNYYDITTPYGYGGPICNTEDRELIQKFRQAFNTYCQEENIVTEFVRFHPLLNNAELFKTCMDAQYVRGTVYIDLTKDEEEIFRNISKSNRNRFRKAVKENLCFNVLDAKEAMNRLDEFLALYYSTMERKTATAYYYFPQDYFERLFNDLSEQVKLAIVTLDDQIVTADILFCCGEIINSHLNGGDPEFFRLGSNVLLNYKVALWGKEEGYKYLHLGGGYADNDSLFKFKASFNPSGIAKYYTGKIVHDESVYRQLIEQWESENSQKNYNPDYFPIYRQ